MDKRIAFQWARALESGKYRKGKGALKKRGRYCCLGVLCELSKKGEWEQKSVTNANYYLGEMAELPREVMRWAKMSENDGAFYTHKFGNTSLTGINDGSSKPFREIAKIIRQNWKQL